MSSSDESSEEETTADPVSQELLLDELSADTLAALQSHLQREQESSSDDEEEDGGAGVSEDFGLSQFWVRAPRPAAPRACTTRAACSAPPGAAARRPHCGSRRRRLQYDGDTARRLAQEAIEHAKGGTIAILSAPSAFKALREIVRKPPAAAAGLAISHPHGRTRHNSACRAGAGEQPRFHL
eukprot:COSAG06_NODE_254_length_19039_cov_5.465488_15_plen_182_part_00